MKRDTDISQEVALIWNTANDVLRDIFQRTEYPDIIYPMVLIRRIEGVMIAKTEQLKKELESQLSKVDMKTQEQILNRKLLQEIKFNNTSGKTLAIIAGEGESSIKNNFITYLNGYTDNIKIIIDRSGIRAHINKLAEEKILYTLIKDFSEIDLSPEKVSNIKMGYIFEELVRRFSEANNAVTKGPNPNAEMKDSGIEWIGEVPKHWKLKRMKNASELINGYSFNSELFGDEGIPVLRIGDIKPKIDLEAAKKIIPKETDDFSQFEVKKGDFLLALTGATIGKSSEYNLEEIALLNQRVAIIRPRKELNRRFLKYVIDNPKFVDYINYQCYGGAQENIGKGEIGDYYMVVPDISEQLAIVNYLDDQISKDFLKAIGQTGVVAYCKKSNDVRLALGERLENYRNPEIPINAPVIVTILHKFSFLKDIADQTGKNICFIIDEAHTSQEGRLHEKMVDIFDEATEQTIQQKIEEEENEQEELIDEIARKEFPNLCFIALTATPSDKTIQHFGKEGRAFDVYSMDEAIDEGYIMDVAKNIITYETLYELNYKLPDDYQQNEYPTLQVYRALKLKAFEDDEVIKEKCKIIVSIFKDCTADKIEGKAKSMIVTSSRLCAVKYKLFLDEELKRRGLKWKTLVAFTGQINYNDTFYTETEMNRSNNPRSQKIEDCFAEHDDIRFLIVANKFQVGFSEKLLHTMFLDKALQDRNAVQTISRLNRIYPGKKFDTLTVDFTNSYDKIIKAFRKYQSNVESHKEANPDDLYKIKDELLKRGIFTMEDVEECVKLFNSENRADITPLLALLSKIKGILQAKVDIDKQREFRTSLARYVRLFGFIHRLFRLRFKDKILIDFNIFATLLYKELDPTMSAEDLEKEIEKVKLKIFDIEKISEGRDDENEGENGGGQRGSGNITNVRPMATVEEVVMDINQRFKERVSPEVVKVVENYLQALQKADELKTTIKNNLYQDERQVYELVIKGTMDKLYTDYIINHSPQHFGELTQENIQGYINQIAYKMLREILRTTV